MNNAAAELLPSSESPFMQERYKSLFLAVINQFLMDLNSTNELVRDDAASFFNSSNLDMYLEHLDIDPEAFRERLARQDENVLRR